LSGIAGWYRAGEGAASEEAVLGMLQAMPHRAVDGARVLVRGNAGLGHCMLRTTPEAAWESLPWHWQEPDIVITADARIDNRDDLVRHLKVLPRLGPTPSDSEVIAAAYERWGTGCVEHLVGDFAFAIWDGRRRQLFCARDHVGVKPFYYHRGQDGSVTFASEIGALLRSGVVPSGVSDEKIADYLLVTDNDPESTFFAEIRRLPAGHVLVARDNRTEVTRYWEPALPEELDYGADQAYTDQFLELFTESVRCRLRTNERVAVTLSGGLDSSSIAGVASRVLTGTELPPLMTYSRIFGRGKKHDESDFIHAVLGHGHYEARLVPHDPATFLPISLLRDVVRHAGGPVYAPNISQAWLLWQEIGRGPARVVSTGMAETKSSRTPMAAFRSLRGSTNGSPWARELRGVADADNSFLRLFFHYSLAAAAPFAMRHRVTRRLFRMIVNAESRQRYRHSAHINTLAPAFAASIDARGRQRQSTGPNAGATSERHEHHATILRGMRSPAFEILNAKAAAASVEFRCPFWDRRLVEYCLRLPSAQKRAGGSGRLVLRRAMEGILPSEVQWRPDKADFYPIVEEALYRNETGALFQIRDDFGVIERYVDAGVFGDAFERVRRRTLMRSDYLLLFQSAALYYWLVEQEDWRRSGTRDPWQSASVSGSDPRSRHCGCPAPAWEFTAGGFGCSRCGLAASIDDLGIARCGSASTAWPMVPAELAQKASGLQTREQALEALASAVAGLPQGRADAIRSLLTERQQAPLALLGSIRPGSRVLLAGGGWSGLASALGFLHAETWAADSSYERLRFDLLLDDARPDVAVHLSLAERLPFPDGHFDSVFVRLDAWSPRRRSSGFGQRRADRRRMLAEMSRTLSFGGILVALLEDDPRTGRRRKPHLLLSARTRRRRALADLAEEGLSLQQGFVPCPSFEFWEELVPQPKWRDHERSGGHGRRHPRRSLGRRLLQRSGVSLPRQLLVVAGKSGGGTAAGPPLFAALPQFSVPNPPVLRKLVGEKVALVGDRYFVKYPLSTFMERHVVDEVHATAAARRTAFAPAVVRWAAMQEWLGTKHSVFPIIERDLRATPGHVGGSPGRVPGRTATIGGTAAHHGIVGPALHGLSNGPRLLARGPQICWSTLSGGCRTRSCSSACRTGTLGLRNVLMRRTDGGMTIIDWEPGVVLRDPLFLDLWHATFTHTAHGMGDLVDPAFRAVAEERTASPLAPVLYASLGDLLPAEAATLWGCTSAPGVTDRLQGNPRMFTRMFELCRKLLAGNADPAAP
jgi:asparagine synthase (glutamine-hydrolysing)